MTTIRSNQPPGAEALAAAVTARDRRALSCAITIVESTRADHRAAVERMLAPATGAALRLWLSGIPGAGKSSFIETLGAYVLQREYRVAVLAADPSSNRSGGSILGDETRMETLARAPSAFIRPSPGGGGARGKRFWYEKPPGSTSSSSRPSASASRRSPSPT